MANPTAAQRAEWRRQHAAAMVAAGRCQNDNRRRTHGRPTKPGGVCRRCVLARRKAHERWRRQRGERPRSTFTLSSTTKDRRSRQHRANMARQNRCANDNRRRTHGPPVNGGTRCAACVRVHRRSNKTRDERAAKPPADRVPLRRRV